MIRRHATCDCTRSATFVLRFAIWKLAISHEASYAVAYADGCCHPPLADSAFRMPPVPGRHAPGSMEKIKLSCSFPQDTIIIPHRHCKWQARDFENFNALQFCQPVNRTNGLWQRPCKLQARVLGNRHVGSVSKGRPSSSRIRRGRRSSSGTARRGCRFRRPCGRGLCP